jgi:hypothetical protein
MATAIALSLGLAVGGAALANESVAEVRGKVIGLAGACPDLWFTVDGQNIVTDATTRFDGGICGDVRAGRRVEVEGVLRDGTMYARQVDLLN